MKLKEIHRILKFKQKYWMKPYIDSNKSKFTSCKNYLKAAPLDNKINHLEKIVQIQTMLKQIINNS